MLTRDTADFNGTIEQLTTDDGNFYAVPFRSDFWVLYYNKDLFDAAGVEYPSNDMTMEDYDALARKMTSGEGRPEGLRLPLPHLAFCRVPVLHPGR